MLRRHSHRCADKDIFVILDAVFVCRNTVRGCSCPTTAVRGRPQSSTDSRHPVLAVYSVPSCTKKLQCKRNEWCYELYRLCLYRMVSWFQNRNCMKSTFIKHAHYVQITTIEGTPAVCICYYSQGCICGRAKSIADASAHLWSFITPYTGNTT